jgi:hypothetical protein
MRKLHVGFMKDLCNYDFDRLYQLITEHVEGEQIEDLDIQANLERAISHQKKFHKAFAKRERNPYTVANDELIKQRTQCLMMLRNRLKSYLPSFIPQEQAAAKCIHFVMRQYGKKYFVRSNKTQADLVDKLNYHINKSGDFKDAFSTLGFNGLMAQINELTQEINQNYKQYITTSTQIQEQRKGVRKAAYIDLKIMIEGIMYKFHICRENQAKRDELEELMNYIYLTLQPFNTLLKSRKTQRANKRAAQKEKEVALEKMKTEPQKALPVGDDTSALLRDELSTSYADIESSNLATSEVRVFTNSISSKDTLKDRWTKNEEFSNNLGGENNMKASEPIVSNNDEKATKSKFPINKPSASNLSANSLSVADSSPDKQKLEQVEEQELSSVIDRY